MKNISKTDGDPYIKVTCLGDGWGIRLFRPNGTIHSEGHADCKFMIGVIARNLLRWWDKMGGMSKYASRARHRQGEKDSQRGKS